MSSLAIALCAAFAIMVILAVRPGRSWRRLAGGTAGGVLVASSLQCHRDYFAEARRADATAIAFVDAIEQGRPLDPFVCRADPSPESLAAVAELYRDCSHARVESRDTSLFDGDPVVLNVRVYCRDGRMWSFMLAEDRRCSTSAERFFVSF